MARAAKVLERMRRNPHDWRIEDLQALAARHGVDADHNGTSHVISRHPAAGRLAVPANRPIKPIYVRLFVQFIDGLEASHES